MWRRWRARLQPGLDRRVLCVEVRQVGHEVLHDRHVRQRIDLYVAFDFIVGPRTGKRVAAINIHGAGATDAFPAGAPERQCRINLILDLDQRVENHWTAVIHVDLVGVHARVLAAIRIVAVHSIRPCVAGSIGCSEMPALPDPRVFWESELGHQYTLAFGST